MNNRKIFSLLPLIIFLFIMLYLLMASTSAVVNVVSVDKREIVVQNMSGDQNLTSIEPSAK
jgi:hypothetical protein